MGTVTVSPWKRLREFLSPEREDLWSIFLYGIGVGVLSLVVPITAQALVNTAAFGTVLQPVFILAVVVFSLLALAGVLRALQVIATERLQQRIFARMAIDLAYRPPRVRSETYNEQRGPELVNRFMDVMTVQKATGLILMDGFALALQSVIGLVLLALYNPLLLGFDVLLIGCMTFILFGLGRVAVRTSVAESYRKYEVVAWLEELARVPSAFWGQAGTDLALRKADSATQAYLEARQKHFRILMRQVVGSLALQALASGLLLGVGGWLVAKQQLTLGQLVAAELIVAPVVASFAKFGKYLETFYDLLAAVDKVGYLFDLPLIRSKAPADSTALMTSQPFSLRLREVALSPETSNHRLSLQFEPGSRIALLGPHGIGKSLLMDVVLGIRTPAQGVVELDGVDLREISSEALRNHILLVRGVEIFDGTVLENLQVGRQDATLEDVRQALASVGLLDAVASLPNGLNTHLSGNHAELSTGQAHQLMLARALVSRPRLLVLDEALDSLNPDLQNQILSTFLEPGRPWTLLLSTHLEALASRCDVTVRWQNGIWTESRR